MFTKMSLFALLFKTCHLDLTSSVFLVLSFLDSPLDQNCAFSCMQFSLPDPKHFWRLQSRASESSSGQLAPPLEGVGESHFRCRVSYPSPQDWEHGENGDQFDQPPLVGFRDFAIFTSRNDSPALGLIRNWPSIKRQVVPFNSQPEHPEYAEQYAAQIILFLWIKDEHN